jgi:hypothetical protein
VAYPSLHCAASCSTKIKNEHAPEHAPTDASDSIKSTVRNHHTLSEKGREAQALFVPNLVLAIAVPLHAADASGPIEKRGGSTVSTRDVRSMTIGELGLLADDIRTLPRLSEEYAQARELVALASLFLHNTGALGQLLWWADGVEPEAPPDARRPKVVEMQAR